MSGPYPAGPCACHLLPSISTYAQVTVEGRTHERAVCYDGDPPLAPPRLASVRLLEPTPDQTAGSPVLEQRCYDLARRAYLTAALLLAAVAVLGRRR